MSDLARAVLSIDGDYACALLGENIQDGECEFVKVNYPDGINRGTSGSNLAERIAASQAFRKLRKRLEIPMTYAYGIGISNGPGA